MVKNYQSILKNPYPQNYILRKPLKGGLIVFVSWLLFIVIYKPLQPSARPELGFIFTMAIYSLVAGIQVAVSAIIIRKIGYFSDDGQWNVTKEVIAILLTLFLVGCAIYFFGFLIEPKEPRWNWATFIDSCLKSFMVGIIPFAFFSIINYQHLHYQKLYFKGQNNNKVNDSENQEKQIQINSKLKKEHLEFSKNEFIYAESEGNYVIFYLYRENEIQKKMIRNALNDVEEQMESEPHVFRTHRAFLVNLTKIYKISGNSLGYRIKFKETTFEVPVSRKNAAIFKNKIKEYIHNT